MKLTIKNMVCRHCVECVRRLFDTMPGVTLRSVELGSVELDGEISQQKLDEIDAALRSEGFELIRSREAEIVEGIKRILIDLTRNDDPDRPRESLQAVLDGRYSLGYPALSRLFSEVEGRTIESYHVALRVERVKELIRYRRLSLSEIAYLIGYSSVAHLSRQFKQVTGMTPTEFRSLGVARTPLPEL